MMTRSLLGAAFLAVLSHSSAFAQETRSMMFGRVLDPQGSAVVGATVTVRNADTGVSLNFKTNDTGYYEANLLLPGNYELTAEHAGFKKHIRKGINLPVSSRLEIALPLEIGGISETVSVTAEAPLLETNAVSSGRVLDNKTVMELPVMGNSAMLLVKLTPGIQTGGVNNYLALHSNAGGSDYSVGGNIGGNSWSMDGSPNQGPGRRAAYLPYTDAVSEFKVETNNFDASIGQTSGAAIQMISKSGSNEFHGTATWQHWQQRWQGSPFFTKKAYYSRIAAADAAGNTTLANQLRNTDKQPTGRSNNWGASGGGPVIIPKIYNGKNKLFWFFTYNGFKDIKVEDSTQFNRTVPTLGAREGNFADMLTLPNGARNQVYDPASTVPDPARPTHFIRTPFAGNVIPKSRFVNPAYNKIRDFYPLPNNTIAGQDPNNNYLASMTPYNWDYKAYSNRVDYQINDKFRMYGRWSFNNFGPEDRGDWTYESARGLNLGGLVRNNKGGNVDLVYTQSGSTIWDFNVAINQFREGNIQPKALEYKPSDLGLPAYMDAKAAGQTILPQMNVNGYSTMGPGGITNWTRTRSQTFKAEVSHVRGNHTIRAAFDTRGMFRTGGGGGNTSGNFAFANSYTKKYDDDLAPSQNLGLAWAAFVLGTPNSISVATNDNYAMYTPYYAGFVQDNWRLTPKLTLNFGLRTEWEGGATERYNRMIAGFDPTLTLPITAGAQAAYAANPIPELAAANFKVLGGTNYVNANGQPRNWFQNELLWLPRIGAAYQWNDKTVIRVGYGIFYDTLNVMNFGPDQSGFSRGTGTNITNDFGATWNFPANANPGNGNSPLNDPFPIRADGTRFDVPTGAALGSMAKAGRGYDYTSFDQPHARQQRWRAGFQRQVGRSIVVDAAYAGSYSDNISIQRRETTLPQQYWATGTVRNDALANNLNSNVTNPFQLKNFAGLATTNPVIYQDMSTQGFYNSTTIRKHQLLRPMPHVSSGNGLRRNSTPDSYTKTHEFQLNVEKRFSQGFNLNFGYTAMKLREADFYYNEWDAKPTERASNDGRPYRIVGSGIWEMPVGKGKRFLGGANKGVDLLLGGWQFAATYELQPGPLLDFGSNVFYYGSDLNNIKNVNRTFDTWFNTADFERAAAKGPNSFHSRVFPTRIDGLRRDWTNQWNANAVKNMRFGPDDRLNLQLRLNVLNVQNRSQMDSPSTDPYNTNFGRVLSQTAATNRWLEIQARFTF
ncbi:MAG TPA: carboxypeptidase-like regulatory domain-containing protein [Paludibaculum sp.]|jgi:hypothetical protein